ncbi:MAG: hypothetical protein E7F06_16265 [Lachnospiraceae bacterium]|nr:hypothetical protein [Lachnospiraceae bacterium]
MLYLFLTGNRSAYLNAIFTVLHFPKNTVYDLKYKIMDTNSIVHCSAKDYVKFTDALDEPILILFNNEDGKYIPLRFGKLKEYIEEEGQIYYSVQLTEYCHTESEVDFCNFIDSISPEKVRRLTGSSDNKAEGILAFLNERQPLETILKQSEDSWIRTVRPLSDLMEEMDIFKQYYLIFTKMEIKRDNGHDQLDSENGRVNLKSGEDYKIHMSYYISEFNKNPMEVISGKFYQSQECLGIMNSGVTFLSQQNKVDIVCSPRASVTENKKVTIGFEIPRKKVNNKIIQYVHTPLELNLKPRIPREMRKAIIALFFGLSFIGTYLAGIKFGENAQNYEIAWRAVGSLITSLSTIGMIYFMGKPKL